MAGALRRRGRGDESAGAPVQPEVQRRLSRGVQARASAVAHGNGESHSRNAGPALVARRVGPCRGRPSAAYADCPAGASGSIYARGGNACAMVQRWATGRRGTANLVAFETNERTEKLIE